MTVEQARLAKVLGASPHIAELARQVLGEVPGDAGATEAGCADFLAMPMSVHVDAAIAELDNLAGEEAQIMRALRKARQRASLAIALADCTGLSTVDDTITALSRFADAAIEAALKAAFLLEGQGGRWRPAEEGATAEVRGFVVLGMGKLGAGELNYSSDVDLILLHDPAILDADTSDRVEPGPFAVRVARRLVRLLQERTADGFVVRTDLRLRPDPASTPLALSFQAAMNYYEAQGRTWERAALIKARAVAGDRVLGERFLSAIKPFIWRRHLDYAAIDAIRGIKRRINAHKGFGAITVPGHDVKLGRGGIREIEFFAQTQQLIAGGRNPALRVRQTKRALDGLASEGWIEPDVAQTMAATYDHLRRVEHAVQMLRDEQTHRLPQDDDARAAVATLVNEDLRVFDERVRQSFETVHGHFTALFPEEDETFDPFDEALSEADYRQLHEMGYEKPTDVHRMLQSWLKGTMAATASEAARERLREVGPKLIRTFGRTDRPYAALLALDDFLRGLPSGVQFFSMLASNPPVIELLARIMGTAPKLAATLARRPRLFDALLDPRFFGSLPSRDAIRADLVRAMEEAPTYEAKLNASRVVGQEHHFLIGVRLLSQTLTGDEAAAAYTALAEETVLAMLDLAQADVRAAHGGFDGASLCVLCMGKLGSGELTASSDLDLLLIYDLPGDSLESDGDRPLPPSHYYTRVTQRLIAALSAPTAEGQLYELDMRLRPSGNAGPLATSLTAFARYQTTSARTWEHMALTRGRPIGRDAAAVDALESTIRDVLTRPANPAHIVEEVAAMRALIEREKPARDVFDLKLAPGGIIDVEFIAQGLQLLHGHRNPLILKPGTGDALAALRDAGLLSPDDGAVLCDAFRLFSNLSQIMRLCVDGPFVPADAAPSLRRLVTQACDLPSMDTVATHLQQTQAQIRKRFERLFPAVDTTCPRSSLGGDIPEGEKP